MQHFMDAFEAACTALGLTISHKKTVVLYQPAPGEHYKEPSIYVYGKRLVAVSKFVYLGSTLSLSGSIDEEVCLRISKANDAFGRLNKRLWNRHEISLKTKIKVYGACVLTALLYACETWTTYRKHTKRLERFHQQCLRKILGVRWEMYLSDVEVLDRAKCPSIEALINKHRMRWCGHMVRMDDTHLPKQLFYGELADGERLVRKPKLRYKDCLKTTLKNGGRRCTSDRGSSRVTESSMNN